VSKTGEKIQSFAELATSWHYGEGGPVEDDVISTALELEAYLRLLGFSKTDAFPGPDFDVMVVGYRGEHDLEATVRRGGSIDIAHIEGRNEVSFVSVNSIRDAKRAISRLGGEIWQSFDWSMRGTSMSTGNDSAVRHSETPRAGEFRSYAEPAWTQASERYATTSPAFMMTESLGTPQSSGQFPPTRMRRRAA